MLSLFALTECFASFVLCLLRVWITGEEEDRLGVWWRKCWADGFDLSESV